MSTISPPRSRSTVATIPSLSISAGMALPLPVNTTQRMGDIHLQNFLEGLAYRFDVLTLLHLGLQYLGITQVQHTVLHAKHLAGF